MVLILGERPSRRSRNRVTRPRTLVWVDRQGHEVPIKGVPPRMYWYPRLSPDGTRVALVLRDQAHDIWVWDLARETLGRLTLEPTFERVGVWGHDGKTVIYTSSTLSAPNAPRSLFRRSADFTGPAEPLIQGAVGIFPSTVTPDGTALILRVHTHRRPKWELCSGRTFTSCHWQASIGCSRS
jgi:Tol biopolymer transport system component